MGNIWWLQIYKWEDLLFSIFHFNYKLKHLCFLAVVLNKTCNLETTTVKVRFMHQPIG